MTVISPASQLPVIQGNPPARQPAPRREAVAAPSDAPAALSRQAAPAPRVPIGAGSEHPALTHYRAVQRLPTDETETWIGRIDTWA